MFSGLIIWLWITSWYALFWRGQFLPLSHSLFLCSDFRWVEASWDLSHPLCHVYCCSPSSFLIWACCWDLIGPASNTTRGGSLIEKIPDPLASRLILSSITQCFLNLNCYRCLVDESQRLAYITLHFYWLSFSVIYSSLLQREVSIMKGDN